MSTPHRVVTENCPLILVALVNYQLRYRGRMAFKQHLKVYSVVANSWFASKWYGWPIRTNIFIQLLIFYPFIVWGTNLTQIGFYGMLHPSMQTLHHLCTKTAFDDRTEGTDPFCSLSNEPEKIKKIKKPSKLSNNIIVIHSGCWSNFGCRVTRHVGSPWHSGCSTWVAKASARSIRYCS